MTVFIPGEDDADPDAEAQMHMGKGGPEENDLRDPWFHTDEGKAWLAAHPETGES